MSSLLAFALAGLLLAPVTLSVLALSLLLDNGCLRVGAFLFGWFFLTPLMGVLLTLLFVLAAGIEGNLSGEAGVVMLFFVLGYPIVAVVLHRYFQGLPEEEVETWKQTLTSGALLGFGAGSVGKAASGAASYGGFGGGSFGGGGAGGSFKGGAAASGQAAKAAGSAGAAGESSAAAATAASGTTAAATHEANDRAADAASDEPPDRPSTTAGTASEQGKASTGSFGIWHVVGFLLVAVGFLPLGIGLTSLFSTPWVLKSGLGILGLYAAYRGWAWAFPSHAETVVRWAAQWHPSRYWAHVKRKKATAIPLYVGAFLLGGPIGLVGMALFLWSQDAPPAPDDASVEGGTASSSWQ